MKRSISIMLVGGGTGGHFYPLISIAEKLVEQDTSLQLHYMGPTPYDANALLTTGITYHYCPAGKRRKYFSLLNIFDFIKTLFGICIATIKLYVLYPDIIVSKGGYTSVPVIIGAFILSIPIIVHESDTRIGSANKLAMRFARHIAISFTQTSQFLTLAQQEKTILTGIPIRTALLKGASARARAVLGVENNLPIILILGGSQGAENINQMILDSLDELLPHYNIVHQTGVKNFDTTVLSAQGLIQEEDLSKRYIPISFFSDPAIMNDAYSVASIIISRAGAGTIYEIASHGKPAILIPIPESVSHDQRTNAYAYAEKGAAIVLEEGNSTGNLLRSEIERIMQNREEYDSMSACAQAFAQLDASSHIAELIFSETKKH